LSTGRQSFKRRKVVTFNQFNIIIDAGVPGISPPYKFTITCIEWAYFEYKFTITCIERACSRSIELIFSPCSVSFVLIGEYIQYSPLINFRLIIPCDIHLQCLCSTKNEKKQHNEGNIYGIKNYFYSDSLTRPRSMKNKYVILRHLGDMCLFTYPLVASK
jgi:hypothetical protein